MRDSTIDSPSTASSSPARQPRRVDLVIRRTMRASIRTASVPSTAGMNRQPNGVTPNIHSPSPITHFPIGGCTMNDAYPVNTWVLPCRIRWLASCTVLCS